jgi:hypothetical protein
VDHKHLAGLAIAVAVLGLVAAVAAVQHLRQPGPAAAPSTVPARADSPFGPAPAGASVPDPADQQPATATPAPASRAEAPPPYGLSAEEWRQLQAALAGHPQREAELARIGAYMAYMRSVERFRQLRGQAREPGSPPPAELQALARTLEAELPQHLERGELSAGEAMQLRLATQEVLQPDAAARQAALALWQQGLAQAAAQKRQPDPREAQFQQRQAALVAAWSAQPPEQRDPRALEAQLDALRQSIFTPAP